MDQNNLKNIKKLPYEVPQIQKLGELSQLIQGCSSPAADAFPNTSGAHNPLTDKHDCGT